MPPTGYAPKTLAQRDITIRGERDYDGTGFLVVMFSRTQILTVRCGPIHDASVTLLYGDATAYYSRSRVVYALVQRVFDILPVALL